MTKDSFLLFMQEFSHVGVAGEGIQTFDIAVPLEARVIGYTFMVDGANAPITHRLDYLNHIKVAGKDWTNTLLNNIYNSANLTEGGAITGLQTSTHLRWRVQSAAGSGNEFLLRLSLWRI